MQKNFKLNSLKSCKLILSEFDLCDSCLGRLISKKNEKGSRKRGMIFRKKAEKKDSKKCYVCKNLLDGLDYALEKIMAASLRYQFGSFLIGAILKPSIIERDDQIRSKFKLRGMDGIKTEITKTLSQKFSKKTKSEINYLNPDLTVTFNFKDDSCDVRAKPIIIFGRYNKLSREISQKQHVCENCKGSGCLQCSHHGLSGFDSVEGNICKYLYTKFDCRQAKITWIGGEDKTSLVLKNGRPFFAKIIDPHKRKVRFPKKISLDKITLSKMRVVKNIPKNPLRFKTKIEMTLACQGSIEDEKLELLEGMVGSDITVADMSGKKSQKHVYALKPKRLSQNSFSIRITVDGGLPIKRFVDDVCVDPNLNKIMKSNCVCKRFDFHGIQIQ